jgi:hypothetical protein
VVEVKTGRASPIPRPRGVDLPESVSLRWRPGARCDARRLARLRTVGKEIAAAPEFRARAGRSGFQTRVDLIEVWLAEPRRTFRILHHEDLRKPLP